jgi:hypothetical protein
MAKKKRTYKKFKAEFEQILKKRHGITIHDCTDDDSLKDEFLDNKTPTESVEYIADKYGLDRIDLSPNNPADRMGEFFAKMDFKLLKEQKTTLIKIQTKLEKPNPKFTKKEWDTMEGIINLLDAIQDVAVDEYGFNEKTVFRISRKGK